MKRNLAAIFLVILFGSSAPASFGQAVRNGLGDATTIITPDKILDSTGNANEIGNFSSGGIGQDSGSFVTRHLRSGNASGIGGSFSGTTNVTAESSPARTGNFAASTVRAVIPSAGVDRPSAVTFSQSMTQRVPTFIPALMPDISNQWNPTLPTMSGLQPTSTSVDFVGGQKNSPATRGFSNTMGVPTFDSYLPSARF